MKKLLILVLIAIAFCTAIEEKTDDEIILQGVNWAELWEKVKKYASQAKKWLQDNGLWEPIINLLKTYGREKAVNWCAQKIPYAVCSSIVDFILNYIR